MTSKMTDTIRTATATDYSPFNTIDTLPDPIIKWSMGKLEPITLKRITTLAEFKRTDLSEVYYVEHISVYHLSASPVVLDGEENPVINPINNRPLIYDYLARFNPRQPVIIDDIADYSKPVQIDGEPIQIDDKPITKPLRVRRFKYDIDVAIATDKRTASGRQVFQTLHGQTDKHVMLPVKASDLSQPLHGYYIKA